MIKQLNSKKFLISFLLTFNAVAFPPINIFRPSDRPLIPEKWPCTRFQPTIAYEGSFSSYGFQETADFSKKTNILQIYQDTQDILAAIKNSPTNSDIGYLSQLFNIDDDNKTKGLITPCGKFQIPLNFMLTSRFHFNHGITLGVFLPIYIMQLSNVTWTTNPNLTAYEANLATNLFEQFIKLSNMDLYGWTRSGIGDFTSEFIWMNHYPQAKPLLKDVRPMARLGLTFPTGKLEDINKILALPFGNEGSFGIIIAGGLDLVFGEYLKGGIDAEFTYLFGSTQIRRIKTDLAQTDLLLTTTAKTFKEFGLGQQFNLYLEFFNICGGLSLKTNYQYLKRNDDRLYPCSNILDANIMNSAENLFDWTAHSMIFNLIYNDGYCFHDELFKPYVSAWVKYGFNGKRAILLNTVGIALTVSF